ncbi:MAG TPA: hypothetical protein VN833_28610 [Candidatus Acidoferrales bacterium]|jgi:hypothetical protein|nr:hypothetical protein [Candidatus Acidoferrales bacterium]
MKTETAEKQLDGFLNAFSPEVSELARKVLAKLRKRLPHAKELVYDNYNALAIGFAPSERASEGIFSIAIYPMHINFFFLQGAKLPDPYGLLQGEGSVVRHIRLEDEKTLDRADVKAMMATAMNLAKVPFDKKTEYKLVIKSVSAKQRPRRPPVAMKKTKK